jgi:hypothetical protein
LAPLLVRESSLIALLQKNKHLPERQVLLVKTL